MNEETLRAQVLACAAMCAVLLKTHPNRDVAQDQAAKMLGRLLGLLMPGATPEATEAAATVVVHSFAAASDLPLSN